MPVLRRTDAASILNLPVVTQPQTTYYSTMMYPTYHIIHYRAVICRTQFYDHISDTADQVNDDCHLILLEEWVYTELRAKAVPDHQDMESNQKKKKRCLSLSWKGQPWLKPHSRARHAPSSHLVSLMMFSAELPTQFIYLGPLRSPPFSSPSSTPYLSISSSTEAQPDLLLFIIMWFSLFLTQNLEGTTAEIVPFLF